MSDDRCKVEGDCTHMPWCRINAKCYKSSEPSMSQDLPVPLPEPGAWIVVKEHAWHHGDGERPTLAYLWPCEFNQEVFPSLDAARKFITDGGWPIGFVAMRLPLEPYARACMAPLQEENVALQRCLDAEFDRAQSAEAELSRLRAQEHILCAKPLVWTQAGNEWYDKCGFHIMPAADDLDYPWTACWGEGDPEGCTTLTEAKEWCQNELDAWVRKVGTLASPPAPAQEKT